MGQQVFINFDTTNLKSSSVASASDLRQKKFTQFVAGDSLELDLFLVGNAGLLNIQNYAEVRLGLGELDARPDSGTYKIGSNTPLAYNHSAAELEAIIDSDVADATVTQLTNFVFKVQFNSTGSQTIPSIDFRLLAPASTVSVTKLATGDASTKETWLWRLYQNPVAFTNSFSDITGQGVRGILSLATSGVYDLLGINKELTTNLELELTDSSGNVRTIMQAEVKLRGEVIGHNFTGSIPVSPSIPPSATTFLESFPDPAIVGDLSIGGLDLSTGAADGYVLTSDASGNASWQASSGASVPFTAQGVSPSIAFIGGDQTGNDRGANSLDIQSKRSGDAKIAKGVESLVVGSESLVTGAKSSSIGRVNEVKSDNSHAIGEQLKLTDTADSSSVIGRDCDVDGVQSIVHGSNITVSSDSSNTIAVGKDIAVSSDADTSVSLGTDIVMQGGQSTAIGYNVEVLKDNGCAIGRNVKVNAVGVSEFGGWLVNGNRDSSVRCANGFVANTLDNISYSPLDGGTTIGDELATKIPREMVSIRRNGDEVLADVNIGGIVKTVSFGDATRIGSGNIQANRTSIGGAIQNNRSDTVTLNSMRQMTQSAYDLITPDANTVYIIVG